ncbi:paeninodin family lasso peptide [Virgibacillus sp. W0181]
MKKTWEKPTLDTLEMKMTKFNVSIMGGDSDSSGDSWDSDGDGMGS